MKQELINKLEKLVKSYPEDYRYRRQKAIDGPLWKDDDNGKEYLDLFTKSTDYKIFDNHLQSLGNQAKNTSLPQLVDWTLNRARVVGAEKTIEELDLYINSTEVSVDFIELVIDTYAECEFEFSNGVKFTSPHNLRNTKLANDLVAEIFGTITPFPKVTAVFISAYNQQIKNISNKVSRSKFTMPELPYENVEDARLCLSLAKNYRYGIHSIATGVIAPDNIPFMDSVSGWNIIPFRHPQLGSQFLESEFRQADKILQKFTKLSPEFKTKLKIPLNKLNNYGSSESQLNRAIELRTCLESIFLSDDNAEQITFRLALRAALFLGDTLEERKQIQAVIKNAYRAASSAVHNGSFKRKDKTEALDKAASYAQRALIKLIDQGDINWEELELKNKLPTTKAKSQACIVEN